MVKPSLWVDYGDCHFPEIHWPTFNAMCSFLKRNPVNGFIFGGDQFDNACISHHTKGKPQLRDEGAFVQDAERFEKQVLNKVESLLPESAERVWIVGNHDQWTYQLIEEHPEFKGLERETSLHLKDRGWRVVPCGQHYRLGKLTVIHGDQLANAGYVTSNHSKKALEIYGQNVLYHHMHAPASATKIMPFDQQEKYMAWCAPAGCTKNPHYLRNRPTAWLNGFTILEMYENGYFNLYPIIVSKGRFAYGGRIYGA